MEIVEAVAEAFGLGTPTSIELLHLGSMNRNWRLDTRSGSYAVKQVLDADLEQTRRQHAAVKGLAGQGFPVPLPVEIPRGGDSVLVRSDGIFTAVRWAAGVHREGRELALGDCAELGRTLARLHRALGSTQPAPPARIEVMVPDPADTLRDIERYLAMIDAKDAPDKDGPDEFDTCVRSRLRRRRELLAAWAHRWPVTTTVEPLAWIHGDFNHTNLLWSGDQVSAVIDWDRLRIAPPASEVVRAATLLFDTDLERVEVFADGYRELAPLGREEIADAAHRRWWGRLCGLWPLDTHYDRSDPGCDRFFDSGEALLDWWCDHYDELLIALGGHRRGA